LLAAGRPGSTPVAAVRWGTRPEQRTVRGTLATIADLGVEAPSAIVIGEVAGLDFGWFERRPLFGRRIVVTRAREHASDLRVRLEHLGAEVIEVPSIALESLEFAFPALDRYQWVVFTSANGVDAWFEHGLIPARLDARALASVRVACIGPSTRQTLARRGIRADLVAERFVAESLLEAFPDPEGGDARVLIARAESARDVLPDGLAARGYHVDVLAVYRTVAVVPDPAVLRCVRAGEVDAVTFTSSSTVTNFCDAIGPLEHRPAVVSIGPVTSATAHARGLRVDAEADPHTIDGLVDALLGKLAGTERPGR
jgi:uroporphyrinogen III methyltransferase/synthase